jgi:hypothetical protein
MNIDAIEINDYSEMPLRHPTTDEPLVMDSGEPMVILLAGEDSPEYKAVMRRWQNEAIRKAGRKLSAEQIETRSFELLAAVTKGWRIEGADGPIEFSPQAAKELYAQKAWIKRQVQDWVYEPANFLQGQLTA